MSRLTKAELEQSNMELRQKLSEIYDELGELLGVDEEEDEDAEDEDSD